MFKKMTAVLMAAVLTTSALTGCGKSSEDNKAASQKLVIGTMNLVNGDLIAQYEKWYETELGVDVDIIKFDSGKDVNSAIASNSIDIGELGTSPAALAISNGIDIDIFWIGDIIGKAETLVAKKDSGIKTLKDLVGKKVATPFASTAHYSLLNALKLEGIDEKDVTVIDMQTDKINAAWQTGDIDAAYVWYPVLAELLKDGTPVTDSEQLADQGVITADAGVVRHEYAEKHPDIITKYVELQLKANDMILNDSDKAAEEIASVLEIDKEDAADQITQFKYLTAEEQIENLDGSFADTLKNTADFLVEQKSITSAPELEEFKNRVTSEYVKKASGN